MVTDLLLALYTVYLFIHITGCNTLKDYFPVIMNTLWSVVHLDIYYLLQLKIYRDFVNKFEIMDKL